MMPMAMTRTLKQGDRVLLQEQGGLYVEEVSLCRIAELTGDQPAEMVIEYVNGNTRTFRYGFQREEQVLFATLTRDDGSIYQAAELLDPHLAGDYFSLSDKRAGWRVTLNGARPCIVRDGVPPDYVPLGVGDPVYGSAIFVGMDHYRDWGLCRLEAGVYAVFLMDDICFPEPTPEEAYFAADMIAAV